MLKHEFTNTLTFLRIKFRFFLNSGSFLFWELHIECTSGTKIVVSIVFFPIPNNFISCILHTISKYNQNDREAMSETAILPTKYLYGKLWSTSVF